MQDAINYYGERISDILSPKSNNDVNLVTKGLVLYRQGMVIKLTRNNDLIHGVVQDVTKVNVMLDLSFPSNSSCSCPAVDICRHQLAVFFAAYSKNASVSGWVDDWKNKENSMYLFKKSLETDAYIKKKVLAEKPEHDYRAWKRYFLDVAHEELKVPPHFMVGVDRAASSFQRAIQRSEPSNRQWVPLYRSIAYYFGLKHLWDLGKKHLESHQSDLIESQMEEIFHAFTDEMGRFENSIRPFDSENFIEAFLQDTRSLSEDPESFAYYKWQVYKSIWSTAMTTKEGRQAERERLLAELENAPIEQIELTTWMLIHLYMVDQQDSYVLEHLKRLGPITCYFLLFQLEEMQHNKEFTRMIPFVDFFSKNIKTYLHEYVSIDYRRTRFLYNALQIIRPFASETKRFDLLERILRETIPFSLIPYSHYLYEKQEYKKWVELQVAERVNVLIEWTVQTKQIQKDQPELLLPIYHQQVVKLIAEKNRSSYRDAVRYLKKLRTIYKKQKQVDKWEHYITYIRESNKRLRAFQEELKKGKLIDAAD